MYGSSRACLGGLAFSYARTVQQPALEIWHGEEAHMPAAQQALYHRAACNGAAHRSEYTAAIEGADTSQHEPATRAKPAA
jgi:fructose-bisphosphate aldolase class I